MPNEPAIRRATQDDLAAVSELFYRWEEEGCTRGLQGESPGMLRDRLGPWFLVAERGGELVGLVVGERKSEHACVFDVPEYLEVQDLYVAPEHRGCGIGTALMRALLEQAEEAGLEQWTVYTGNRDWRRIMAFYERFGFRMWCLQMFRRPDAAGEPRREGAANLR
jgi:GNAT superfamily N-acetyltransferase